MQPLQTLIRRRTPEMSTYALRKPRPASYYAANSHAHFIVTSRLWSRRDKPPRITFDRGDCSAHMPAVLHTQAPPTLFRCRGEFLNPD